MWENNPPCNPTGWAGVAERACCSSSDKTCRTTHHRKMRNSEQWLTTPSNSVKETYRQCCQESIYKCGFREQVQRFSLKNISFEFNKWHRTERLNHPSSLTLILVGGHMIQMHISIRQRTLGTKTRKSKTNQTERKRTSINI